MCDKNLLNKNKKSEDEQPNKGIQTAPHFFVEFHRN